MSNSIRDKYVQYRTNSDNDDKPDSYFCSCNGYPLDDLRSLIANDANLKQDILDARRDQYAGMMLSIDDAMFRAAKSGDTKAADLLYRRFDGWNPKIVEETNNFYNFAEIAKRVAQNEKATRTVIIKRDLPLEDGET